MFQADKPLKDHPIDLEQRMWRHRPLLDESRECQDHALVPPCHRAKASALSGSTRACVTMLTLLVRALMCRRVS
jgi:hypothetical protein